jgi:acrylyl-CoA reductase (NADPH)
MFRTIAASTLLKQQTTSVALIRKMASQQQQQQHRGLFKALVVSLEGEKPNLQAIHKISEFASLEELPAQKKALQKWTGKLATVKIDYSTLNYKDGLVLQGKPGVAKSFPIVPGVDFAGQVVEDPTNTFQPGDSVILTGNYMGQHLNGAYSEQCLVPAEWMLPQPEGLSGLQAMQIGTAGFAAMQSIDTLESFGKLTKDSQVLVMGASGGVGSTAVAILSHLGYKNITASTGRVEENRTMLEALGATTIIPRLEKSRAMDKEEYDAVIDPIGGSVTANVLPRVKYGGAVALSGVAAGPSLEGATVFPFILRGISLLGIDSVQMPHASRQRVWNRVATDFPMKYFDVMGSDVVGLEDLASLSKDILEGKVAGRVVVDVSKSTAAKL